MSLSSSPAAYAAPAVPSLPPEDQELHQLVYISSSKSRTISRDDLQSILSQARTNNVSLGITGLLLYRDGQFVQFLEGPKGPLRKLYNTISSDRRHNSVTVVVDRQVQKRDFEKWSMAFREVAQPNSQPPGSVSEQEAEAFNDLLMHSTLDAVDLPPEMSSTVRSLVRLYHGLLLRM